MNCSRCLQMLRDLRDAFPRARYFVGVKCFECQQYEHDQAIVRVMRTDPFEKQRSNHE